MKKKFKITYNAPVVLSFTLLAVAVHVLGDSVKQYFMTCPRLESVSDYFGLLSHVAGHVSWEHLLGNFTLILLLGPILEERHGSRSLLAMIIVTALVTSLLNFFFFNACVLGASGIVFMFIILASTANIRHREIPLTFIAIAILYLGGEVVAALQEDQVSQMAHLIGGLVGGFFGFFAAGSTPATSAGKK